MSEQDIASSEEIGPVWPPPPNTAPPISYGRPAYVSGRGVAHVVVALLIVGIIFDIVEVISITLGTSADLFAYSIETSLDTLIALIMGVFFLIWTHRSYRNLQAFGISGLRCTPGWAVGYFFVPILSLYRPYQIFLEIWRGSDSSGVAQTGLDWQLTKTPGLLLGWWLCYLGTGVIGAVSGLPGGGDGPIIVSEAVSAAADILAILVVQRVTARQEETARAMSLIG